MATLSSITRSVVVRTVAIVLVILGTLWYIQDLKNDKADALTTARDYRLDLENQAAAFDTTLRVLYDRQRDIAIWRRRAMQADLDASELEEQLGLERRARVRVETQLASLTGSDTASATLEGDTARTYTFSFYRAPTHVETEVWVPEENSLDAQAIFQVTLDPLTLDLTVTCAETDTLGVRSAYVLVEGPSWLDPSVSSTFEPDICSPIIQPTQAWYDTWDTGVAGTAAALLLLDGRDQAAGIVAAAWALYRGGRWLLSR